MVPYRRLLVLHCKWMPRMRLPSCNSGLRLLQTPRRKSQSLLKRLGIRQPARQTDEWATTVGAAAREGAEREVAPKVAEAKAVVV